MPQIPKKNTPLKKKSSSVPVSRELDKHVEVWGHPGQPSITMGRIFFDGLPRADIYMEKRNEILVLQSFKSTGFTVEFRN